MAKILVSDPIADSAVAALKDLGHDVDIKTGMSPEELIATIGDYECIIVRSATKLRHPAIDAATNMKLIIRGGVGLDNIDVDYARSKGIEVFNTASASAIAVAELAFALMISVPTRLVEGHLGMREKQWLKKQLKRTELMGKTLGLIGAGNIGTELARRAKAFGMEVIAYDPVLSDHDVVELVDFDALLGRSDYISLHVPLIDATRGMINAGAIAKMKDGAVLVNTARGGCVVEEDVVAALESGKLRAYAVDVYLSDPPAEDCPLYDAPNVVMTPHLGASSKENMLRIGDVVVEIIRNFIKKA